MVVRNKLQACEEDGGQGAVHYPGAEGGLELRGGVGGRGVEAENLGWRGERVEYPARVSAAAVAVVRQDGPESPHRATPRHKRRRWRRRPRPAQGHAMAARREGGGGGGGHPGCHARARARRDRRHVLGRLPVLCFAARCVCSCGGEKLTLY
uniref:Uncharacterized protein n=1 Tax=Oryza brachyantha TaxID=4533 RepID=J3M6X2_ORYBR